MTKQYVLIGGSSGIGLALAKQLQANGDQVTTICRNGDHSCDMQVETPDLPSAEILDGLVYLPGTINLKPFSQLSTQDFTQDFQLNVLGAVKAIQHFLPALNAGVQSSIVLMSSVAASRGFPFHASVSSSKGAIIGLMRALAAELAPKIRVNAVAPSLTETPLSAPLIDSEQKKATAAKKHPLGRIGTPEDVANMIAYLLSDQSSWITGQVLGVDGGISTL